MSADQSTETLSASTWFKSSYSGTSGGDCIEVATGPAAVRVRDSKRGHGPILRFGADSWSAFVAYAKARSGATSD